jgi:cytidine deaminase
LQLQKTKYIMKHITLSTPVSVYERSEVSAADAALIDKACQATYRSYAPYSHFCVGAAIVLDNGEVITGANQENAAFPSGTCAERSACYFAGANYPDAKFIKIVIAARGEDGEFVEKPISPCGACRQALLEYETLAGHDVEVMLVSRSEVYVVPSVKALLPLAFTEF